MHFHVVELAIHFSPATRFTLATRFIQSTQTKARARPAATDTRLSSSADSRRAATGLQLSSCACPNIASVRAPCTQSLRSAAAALRGACPAAE